MTGPKRARPPASGIPAGGQSDHGPGCECTRCRGFEQGNTLSTRHGAYAIVGIRGRAAEIADGLVGLIPERQWSPMFGPAVEVAAVVLARLERGQRALASLDERLDEQGADPVAAYLATAEVAEKLRKDVRLWSEAAMKHLAALGLTPTAQARLLRDAGVGRDAASRSTLREYVAERYSERGEGAS